MIRKYRVQLKKELTRNIGQTIENVEKTLKVDRLIYNDLIFLKSRYYNSKTAHTKGVVKDGDYRILLNQDMQYLIDLIDKVTENDLNFDAVETYFAEHGIEFVRPESQELKEAPLIFGVSAPIRRKEEIKSRNFAEFKWMEENPFYLESFDSTAPQAPVFQNYQEELWSGKVVNGYYQLENRVDDIAVRYHYLSLNGLDMSHLPATIEVKINTVGDYPGPTCGLIFCFNHETRYYYAFIVGNDGEYKLWLKGEGGYKTIISGRSNLLTPGRFNKIGVIKSGQLIYLFINDNYLRRVEDMTLSGGDSGIIALGKGQFLFDNLTFYKVDG